MTAEDDKTTLRATCRKQGLADTQTSRGGILPTGLLAMQGSRLARPQMPIAVTGYFPIWTRILGFPDLSTFDNILHRLSILFASYES